MAPRYLIELNMISWLKCVKAVEENVESCVIIDVLENSMEDLYQNEELKEV